MIFFLVLLSNCYLWIGFYEDPEFFSISPFIKSRPCTKFYFSSPLGMQDYGDKNLTKNEEFEEFMFEQYFGTNGIQSKPFSFKFCTMKKVIN